MMVKKANPTAQVHVRNSQIDTLAHECKTVWRNVTDLPGADSEFVIPRKKVHEIHGIDLSLATGFVRSALLFYQDNTAEILLFTHGKRRAQLEHQIRNNQRLMSSESPLKIEEANVRNIFDAEGLSIPADTGREQLNYRKMFKLLEEYFSWIGD